MARRTFINAAGHLTIVPLEDGTSVHLGPGAAVVLTDTQLAGNARVEKLRRLGMLVEQRVRRDASGGGKGVSAAAAAPARRAAKRASKKSKKTRKKKKA